MKHKFTKYHGSMTESLELGLEEKWIYVHYTKGSTERTACLLKTENKTEEEYLENFFDENKVSAEMKNDVKNFFKTNKNSKDNHWNEFTTFLLKTLSLNMVFGIAAAISVYAGFKLGTYLDNRYEIYPTFTLIGIFLGIGVGGLTIYSMIQNYFKNPGEKSKQDKTSVNNEIDTSIDYPTIDVTLEHVRKAVRQFSDNLPKGVFRTILVKDDNSIDFKQLATHLGGIPSKNFYMSKETYDLFEEDEKLIAVEMDMVQKAVDQYVKDHKEYPMLKFDPQRRVNYYLLLQEHYLNKAPVTQFYITDLDGLITHNKPQKKNSSQF